jgi:SAM-dependent methyltransferase
VSFAEQSFDAVVASFSLVHVPRELHRDVLSSIATWLRPGGWLICTMSAGIGEDTMGGFLGVPMYWSGWGTPENLDLVCEAGYGNVTATEESDDEDDRVVTHLWIVAQRGPGRHRRVLTA